MVGITGKLKNDYFSHRSDGLSTEQAKDKLNITKDSARYYEREYKSLLDMFGNNNTTEVSAMTPHEYVTEPTSSIQMQNLTFPWWQNTTFILSSIGIIGIVVILVLLIYITVKQNQTINDSDSKHREVMDTLREEKISKLKAEQELDKTRHELTKEKEISKRLANELEQERIRCKGYTNDLINI